jgi:alginate O-acetyltransferase complex protein AlgI
MLFNSAVYGIFLFVAYTVFWALRTRKAARALFLITASYIFYFYGTYDTVRSTSIPFGAWGWSFLCLGIIFVGSTLDYYVARLLAVTEDPLKRKGLLFASVVYYLGVLAIFKYFDFAVTSFADAAAAVGFKIQPRTLGLVLPFGISFFTFETMSYTIDVYRRELEPADNYVDYLLFVCFFPHLVAGPIVRPHSILPQLKAPPVLTESMKAEALFLIGKGIAKKVVIGDYLATNMVKRVFDNPERYSSLETLVAVYCYAIQIYYDFSGYSDIAIGSSLLFGYRLPFNFNAPYTAQNLQEFWHRWHISLSTWLRDYLYIPLGGSKSSSIFTYRNLMITMLLGGLWHGASWNFVIWGLLHGLALALTRVYQRARGEPAGFFATRYGAGASRVVTTILTFHYVCFAWIFFNAKTFGIAKEVLRRIAEGSVSAVNIPGRVVVILVIGLTLHFFPKHWQVKVREAFEAAPAFVQGTGIAVAAYLIHFSASAKSAPFIYGQF